jgi:hypothetical protein
LNNAGGDGLEMIEGLVFVDFEVDRVIEVGDCVDVTFLSDTGGGDGLGNNEGLIDVVNSDVAEDDEQ